LGKTIVSQEIKTVSLLTEKQKAEWMLKFKNMNSKKMKLEYLKKKSYFNIKFNGKIETCFVVVHKNDEYYKDYYSECKVLFLLN
jgi:hypothetical protein